MQRCAWLFYLLFFSGFPLTSLATWQRAAGRRRREWLSAGLLPATTACGDFEASRKNAVLSYLVYRLRVNYYS